MHVAVQWDLPGGAERAVLADGGGWRGHEELGRVNTGDPENFVRFLRWAFDQCPSDRVIVVISGTGLLDPAASVGRPGTDRTHLFTIADDGNAGDALSISELGSLLHRALEASARNSIDILALDMRELQCLEVAYEVEDAVDLLIAPQTRIPDRGWDFTAVLTACSARLAQPGQPLAPRAMATLLVKTLGAAYEAGVDGEFSLSALDLRQLGNVASAFDTLSLALMHSVGEELVWSARDAVARRLKPAPAPGGEVVAEVEYLYDLPEMLGELQKELAVNAREGLLSVVLNYFSKLDLAQFSFALQSIDDACFTAGSRLRGDSLDRAILDPLATRRRLRRLLEVARVADPHATDQRAALMEDLRQLLTAPVTTPPDRRTWLEGWEDSIVAQLEPGLATEYRTAQQQQQRLRHLAQLTSRVISLIGPTPANPACGDAGGLVCELFVTTKGETKSRHGGVSLFRPRQLDQLVRSDYLRLRFNKKIHWTVLLAVINLIGNHPRALWRILSAVLATADNSTRAALLERITGPGSVIASFREQFVMLAPVKAVVLSLEPDPGSVVLPAPMLRRASDAPEDAAPQAYRVRLEMADRDAIISEVISIVDPDKFKDVLASLVAMLGPAGKASAADIAAIESLGETLGEDVLQDLGITLAKTVEMSREKIHLQLQIPRELMRYPWELMHHKGGWLSEHFALGRQVFTRSGAGGVRSRIPGPLRALVIGNPTCDASPLPYATREAEAIVRTFESLASETDGLIDFVRDRDAHIGKKITEADVRQMLRHGNYDVVHFAGHAAFDADRPESSAWMLSDGPFTAQSIRNTLRWRETQPWLVYMNACEAAQDGTPKAYQTHVLGLVTAMLDQGVNVCIGPLWRIDDVVAADIAQLFYQQLLKQRQTVGEALRFAKAAAKAQYYDPLVHADDATQWDERVAVISWAGLVLYGNSTATIGQRFGAPTPAERETNS
jgi:hypothetical protein